MLKTTANKITLVRIILIPVFLVLAYFNRPWIALVVFIAASLTDLLDGYIARHWHQITNSGKFMAKANLGKDNVLRLAPKVTKPYEMDNMKIIDEVSDIWDKYYDEVGKDVVKFITETPEK